MSRALYNKVLRNLKFTGMLKDLRVKATVEQGWTGSFLKLTFNVTDSHSSDQGTYSSLELLRLDVKTEEDVLRHIRSLIHHALVHEIDEGFNYRGLKPFDPHLKART